MSPEQLSLICESVYLIHVEAGETLVQDGDKGKSFFVVQHGELQVHGSTGKDQKLLPGDSFGELTLLYDSTHQATVTANYSSYVWLLMRSDFQVVSRLNFTSRIASYSEMLLKIPSIEEVADKTNIDMFAGALEELSFLSGEAICTEGEDVGQLFILYDGEAEIKRENKVVGTMKKGDWVGEEALAKFIAADCTVTVTTDEAMACMLDEGSFSVVAKAIHSLKKVEMRSAVGSRQSQVSHNNPFASLVEKENYADGVLKKEMSHLAQMETAKNGERGSAGKKSRGSQFDFRLAIDLRCLQQVGALGEGSFGTVLFMRDPTNQQNYALKGLLKDQIKKENLAQSVSNERSVMALMDSPFIVRLFGTWQDGNCIYFLQEPVLGGELFDLFSENNFFGNIKHAKFYIGCIILGLAHMHSKRVIYRDLKLENCLVSLNGYVKLTDMGIAKMVVGKTYTVCGTADYFAPETLKQTGHNRGADWWACGVLLFMMCAGRSPFDAPEVTQIYKNIMKGFSKVKFPETFPSDLVDVIKSLCRKVPEERITMQKGGVENLQEMPFFTALDWSDLLEMKLPAPFVPERRSDEQIAKTKMEREIHIDMEHVQMWDGGLPHLTHVHHDRVRTSIDHAS
mmetsp:Transcript_9255/g.16329  ORF Transcript_9255/g.16329 Transcript_9255/m.16329 type:complete len:625 (-) Transcript_9255:88-1962(-)